MSGLTDEEAKTYRTMLLEALETHTQTGPLSITEVAYGPRHNEMSFKVSNNDRISISIRRESWS